MWAHPQRSRDQLKRFDRAALLVPRQTQKVQGIEMPLVLPEDRGIVLLRLAQSPLTMKSYRLLEIRGRAWPLITPRCLCHGNVHPASTNETSSRRTRSSTLSQSSNCGWRNRRTVGYQG